MKYTIFCSGRVASDFGADDAGAKEENAGRDVNETHHSPGEGIRTGVDCREVLERAAEEHEDDAHAEDLHAAAGHVEHERLHGERLRRRDGEVPCAFRLEALIRLLRGLRGLRLRLGLYALTSQR